MFLVSLPTARELYRISLRELAYWKRRTVARHSSRSLIIRRNALVHASRHGRYCRSIQRIHSFRTRCWSSLSIELASEWWASSLARFAHHCVRRSMLRSSWGDNVEIVLKFYRVLQPIAEIYNKIWPLIEGYRCSIVMKGMKDKLADKFRLAQKA